MEGAIGFLRHGLYSEGESTENHGGRDQENHSESLGDAGKHGQFISQYNILQHPTCGSSPCFYLSWKERNWKQIAGQRRAQVWSSPYLHRLAWQVSCGSCRCTKISQTWYSLGPLYKMKTCRKNNFSDKKLWGTLLGYI